MLLEKYFSKKHIIIFFLLIGLAVLIVLSAALQQSLLHTLSGIENVIEHHPVLGAFVFVVLTILSAMFVFFSTVVLVPISVVVWGQSVTFLLLLLAWVAGGIFSYILGKYYGMKVIAHFVPVDQIEYYGKIVNQRTHFFKMFLFRLLAPSEIPGYLLGLVRYKFSKYLLVTFLAELPFAWGAIYASKIFVDGKYISFGIFVVFAGAVIATLKYYFNKNAYRSQTKQ